MLFLNISRIVPVTPLGRTPTKPEQQVLKSTAAHYPRTSMQQPQEFFDTVRRLGSRLNLFCSLFGSLVANRWCLAIQIVYIRPHLALNWLEWFSFLTREYAWVNNGFGYDEVQLETRQNYRPCRHFNNSRTGYRHNFISIWRCACMKVCYVLQDFP